MNRETKADARPDASAPDSPDWRPGALLDLLATDVAHGGWCVARDAGGRVCFVRHALPGERVRARITETTAKFARADAVEILDPSPDRVDPPCPHARPGGCGGCDWQHASLPAQRRLKAEVVRQQLRRIAGLDWAVTVEPLPGDRDGLDWRTRVRFSVGPGGAAGLLAHRSHMVAPIGDCPIAHPLIRAADVVRGRWEGAAAVEVAVSPDSGERMVVITPRRPAWPGTRGPGRAARGPGRERAGAADPAAWAGRVPPEQADSVLLAGRHGALAPVRGRGYLRENASGRDWRVSAGTFWQVHPGAADLLAGAVADALRPGPGDVVLDLYCGAGLFAGALAPAVGPAGAVIGIESDPAAVRDARRNLRDMPWVRIHRGDVRAMLGQPGFAEAGLAVLDPPRAGVGRPVIERLLRSFERNDASPERTLRRVAYVSCDPATLARDIAVFGEHGWRLETLRAFDAFPMTHHVECLAVLAPG